MKIFTDRILCNGRGMTLLLLVLTLAPIWWLLGFDFIVYPLIAVGAAIFYPAKHLINGRETYTILEFSLIALIVTFVLRMFAAGAFGADPMRVVASGYNSLLLIMGFCVFRYSRLYWERHFLAGTGSGLLPARRTFTRIILFATVMWLIGLVLQTTSGENVIRFKTLLGLITPPMDNLIRFSQYATISGGDWTAADAYSQRFSILGPDSGASAAVFACAAAFILAATPTRLKTKRAAMLILFVTLIAFTYTRTILASFLAGTLLATALYETWSKKALIFGALGGGLALLLVLNHDRLGDLASYRENSNALRFLSYRLAIEQVLEQNPFFGLGVKPKEDALYGIPTGSHSTFISFFTKGGFLALGLFIFGFYVIPLMQWLKTNRLINTVLKRDQLLREEAYQFFRAQCVIWGWLVFQDCDAPALAALCMFFTLGYIQFFHNKCRRLASSLRQNILTETNTFSLQVSDGTIPIHPLTPKPPIE